MKTEDFRRHAHDMVDWMADYLETVEDYPVRSQVRPGDIAARLPLAPPSEGEELSAIFADFKNDVMPGMTHWQHPGFFAYFPGNSSPPSVLAEMLTATLSAQCMLWETSPAATEMETRVLDWLRQMVGLPDGYHGVIQDSASSATLCAILVAREKATGWRANQSGLGNDGRLVFYTSEEAHSSVAKAARIAGVGDEFLRAIPSDDTFAMRTDDLRAQIEADRKAGLKPAGVVATVGSTGVGGIDPLDEIAAICREHDLYFHVDAAWAGAALILPEERGRAAGIEQADSIVFNPHKWLMTNFDCSAHFVRDPDALVKTLGILPEYLKTVGGSEVIDYRDWGVPLGRRFRALKLWFVIRSYGVEGLQDIIRSHIAWAGELAELIDTASGFELMAPRSLALINFRHLPADVVDDAAIDAINERLLAVINDDGRIYLTRNRIRGRFAIRFSIGQTTTTRAHVLDAWRVIQELAAGLTETRVKPEDAC